MPGKFWESLNKLAAVDGALRLLKKGEP